MIINNFLGGLGNQLFQIAAGYAHSKRMNTEYAINYKMKHVGFGQGHHPIKYKNLLYRNIPETQYEIQLTFNENGFSYTPILGLKNICLFGYFQSEKYFQDHSKEIKNLFKFPPSITNKVKKKINAIKKKKVGVHVRLGDYLNKEYDGVFHKIDYSFYLKKALKNFERGYEFIVFSDDIKLFEKKFKFKEFIYLNNDNEVEDLYALSQCDSVIMSNSSFSWWGSWLGKKKEKIISPDSWFGPKIQNDYDDRFNKNWIKLQTKKA